MGMKLPIRTGAIIGIRDYSIHTVQYKTVCHFVGIGSPHPLTRKRVCLGSKRGGNNTRLWVRGGRRRLDRRHGALFILWTQLKGSKFKSSVTKPIYNLFPKKGKTYSSLSSEQ
jgi:hypothetical protein